MNDSFPDGMLACIERFLRDVHPTLPPGQDVYPELFATDLFFPLQRQREMERMMQIARTIQPQVVMEIGADKGGGIWAWCQSLPSIGIAFACEVRGVPYSDLLAKAFPDIAFFWLDDSSRSPGAVEFVRACLQGRTPDRIDVLFIDGDKGAFEQDFDAYLPLMNPSGIIFMHDIQDREPTAAYRRVCARGYRHEEIVDIRDSQEAMARERAGIPPASSHEGWLRHWQGRSAGVGVVYLDGVKR